MIQQQSEAREKTKITIGPITDSNSQVPTDEEAVIQSDVRQTSYY